MPQRMGEYMAKTQTSKNVTQKLFKNTPKLPKTSKTSKTIQQHLKTIQKCPTTPERYQSTSKTPKNLAPKEETPQKNTPPNHRRDWLLLGAAVGLTAGSFRSARAESVLSDEQKMAILKEQKMGKETIQRFFLNDIIYRKYDLSHLQRCILKKYRPLL